LYQAVVAGIVLAQEDSSGSGTVTLIFYLVIGGAIYFMVLGPRRKMKAARGEMDRVRDSVESGDEIVTVGGIYGRITSTTETDVTIDVGGGTKLRITRRAIAERIGDDEE